MKRIKIKEHNDLMEADTDTIKQEHKSFFQAIEEGPHFYCTCCSRSFFKEQVSKFSNVGKPDTIIFNEIKLLAWICPLK